MTTSRWWLAPVLLALAACGTQQGDDPQPEVAYSVAPTTGEPTPSDDGPVPPVDLAPPTYDPFVAQDVYPGDFGVTCRPPRSADDPSTAFVMAPLEFDSGVSPRSPCQVGVPGTYVSLTLTWTGHGGRPAELRAVALRDERRLRRLGDEADYRRISLTSGTVTTWRYTVADPNDPASTLTNVVLYVQGWSAHYSSFTDSYDTSVSSLVQDTFASGVRGR